MVDNSLQVTGLISGLSTNDIISKMMSVEQQPLIALQNQLSQEQQRADALRDVNTRLSSLLSSIQKLTLSTTINAKTVTTDTPSGSPTLVTATASPNATVGSFSLLINSLATSTSVTSGGASSPQAIGKAVSANQPLASAGFGITPTLGTFSVNGAQITIDASTVLSDGVDAVGADTIFAKIRDATAAIGKQVDVSWGLDANGRQNKLVLTAHDGVTPIQLGAGSDTSNFLTAAGLASLPPATTMTSMINLAEASPSALLNSSQANLDVALNSTTGSFTINGVTINYDASVDSLNDVINRINTSTAGVTAAYDSINDRVTLTSKATGSTLINLQDVTGNFLAAMKLSQNSESLGANANYLLNGQQRYSTSNTVTDAVPGVTLNLTKADPTTTVNLTVGADTAGITGAVQDFISQYNSTMGFIRDKTSYDANQKVGNILLGDATVESIENTLAIMVGGQGAGLSSSAVQSLADIGITTGAVGSAVGTTDNLVLDQNKFTTALQNNPAAVANVLGALTANVTLQSGGTGSISSVSGTPTNHVSGTYTIVSDTQGNLTATFYPSTGGTPTITKGTITASGTNGSLIPGVTLTANSALTAGSNTVTVNFTSIGVGVKIADYLNGLTASGGLFANTQDAAQQEIDDTNKAIQDMQDRLDQRQQDLYQQFTALETTLAKLQSQGSSLSAQIAKLG